MENIIRIADDFAKQYKLALPLRLDTMRHLCDALGYKLLTYAEGAPILEKLSFDDYMHCPAFCTRVMDCNVVFYDDTCSVGTRLFSLAHEIGHIVLRHIATGALGYDASDTAQEREADAFAYALLAPLDALRAARVRTVKQIQRMTLLDRERAAHVLAELQAEQPETPQVKPARPLLSFYASIGVALVLVIASVSVLHFRRLIYTPDTAQSQTFVITARTRAEPTPTEPTLAAAALSADESEQEEVIYITNHGERYHKGNCTYLIGRDTCPLSISCAVDLGKEPCKICFRNYD
ncbi:MAG: hypothetical protein DBX93_06580 [Oscillospiraceae bacterium]|nr:MAG: hypothetical protein DBX93_06580 [Oscillospiraceae bacterium]